LYLSNNILTPLLINYIKEKDSVYLSRKFFFIDEIRTAIFFSVNQKKNIKLYDELRVIDVI